MSDRESGEDQQQQAQNRVDKSRAESPVTEQKGLLVREKSSSIDTCAYEQELATKTLMIQSKRFYLDVKQNRRGRFIKIAEVGAGGKKSRLLLAMSTAAEFRDNLTEFSEHYASLGPPNPDNLPEDGKLKTETMVKDNRRYYLDLKENQRGRFLRVSQTIPRGGPRTHIAIPAQGMIEFRDALTDLLDEFGIEDHDRSELPENRTARVEGKIFYFDVGSNARGVFLRLTEARPGGYRSSITIPERAWSRFRDLMAEFADKMKSKEGQ